MRSLLAARLPGLSATRVTVLDKLSYAASFAGLGPLAHDKRLAFIPGDMAATVLHSLGIDPATVVHTPTGRPVELASGGKPVLELFA